MSLNVMRATLHRPVLASHISKPMNIRSARAATAMVSEGCNRRYYSHLSPLAMKNMYSIADRACMQTQGRIEGDRSSASAASVSRQRTGGQSARCKATVSLCAGVALMQSCMQGAATAPAEGRSRAARNAERKLEVQKAAQEAAETGTAVETSLTSDKTVPDGLQRGRNSRTGPLSNKE